ncbi:NAD(P)-binding protein [Ramicandelaber brevisporus]|nr:NAD(P)-binding protein [Ramicandelaber brevisporus]
MNTPLFETPDGFELQWGTNHIGHFQLVRLLRPRLVRGSRVVVLSSCASNVVSAIDYAALSPDYTTYNRYRAYGHSKLANLIFAKALARRVKADGVAVYAPHPGAVATNLFRHDALTAMLMPVGSFLFRTPLEGALTPIMCALSPEVAAETGYYYADRMRFASHPVADDVAIQDDLWSYTEQVIDAALCR